MSFDTDYENSQKIKINESKSNFIRFCLPNINRTIIKIIRAVASKLSKIFHLKPHGLRPKSQMLLLKVTGLRTLPDHTRFTRASHPFYYQKELLFLTPLFRLGVQR
jgi:hypothetical protein